MPELDFKVTGLAPGAYGMTPLLNFEIEVVNTPPEQAIHSVTLLAQIQIQPAQRRYLPSEKDKLTDIFGAPDTWGQTLRPKLFAIATTTVRAFSGRTTAVLAVPCTYDLNVLSTKYFYALEAGEVPLLFLFSGTIFYAGDQGRLQVQQIAWTKECPYRVPVQAWKEMMEHYYPNTNWLSLQRETFDRLYAYRRAHGLASWDQVLEQLLPAPELLAASENAEAVP